MSSTQIKDLKETNLNARHNFENTYKEQYVMKGILLEKYNETQIALKMQKKKDDQEDIISKLKQITREVEKVQPILDD